MTERQIGLWLTSEGEEELMRRQCLRRKLYPDYMARIVPSSPPTTAARCDLAP